MRLVTFIANESLPWVPFHCHCLENARMIGIGFLSFSVLSFRTVDRVYTALYSSQRVLLTIFFNLIWLEKILHLMLS